MTGYSEEAMAALVERVAALERQMKTHGHEKEAPKPKDEKKD